jgi:hypothetical protein
MPLRTRLSVLVLFCLGFIALVAAVVRTYYYYISQVANYDSSWLGYPVWIAAGVEVNVGLVSVLCVIPTSPDS